MLPGSPWASGCSGQQVKVCLTQDAQLQCRGRGLCGPNIDPRGADPCGTDARRRTRTAWRSSTTLARSSNRRGAVPGRSPLCGLSNGAGGCDSILAGRALSLSSARRSPELYFPPGSAVSISPALIVDPCRPNPIPPIPPPNPPMPDGPLARLPMPPNPIPVPAAHAGHASPCPAHTHARSTRGAHRPTKTSLGLASRSRVAFAWRSGEHCPVSTPQSRERPKGWCRGLRSRSRGQA